MVFLKTAMPATALRSEPASEAVLLGGSNSSESKTPLVTSQALHLSRRCAISVAMAAIIAPLAFGERV